ncbi:putative phosphatidate phosphatase [Lineus longissimus]|uniref:putative phosphatidate phosphatase n=1 Tax=Lineus longissimus TaxID=88925 RepID=UPI002B4F1E15
MATFSKKVAKICKKGIWIGLDTLLLLLACGVAGILHFVIRPRKSGFFCDDTNIKYPNRDDTVSNEVLLVVGFVIPVTFFYVVELASESHKSSKNYICVSLVEVCRVTGIYAFGAMLTIITTFIGKLSLGQLRPNFFDVCRPNISHIVCERGHNFVTNYTCTSGYSENAIDDVFKAFPSGHSAFSSYSMVFLALYLQVRLFVKFSILFKPLLQIMALGLAYYFSLSRISDYKHHWSDCLAGSLLGIAVAFYTAYRIAGLFERKEIPTNSTIVSHAELEEQEQLFQEEAEDRL